jgi:hypothetical protein
MRAGSGTTRKGFRLGKRPSVTAVTAYLTGPGDNSNSPIREIAMKKVIATVAISFALVFAAEMALLTAQLNQVYAETTSNNPNC